MSDSESDYYKSTSSIERNKATPKSAGDNKKRKPRSSNSAPPSKKPTTISDIFGVRNQDADTMSGEDGQHQLTSYFVNRVGNGCERRVAVTEGEYYIDIKVYKTEDARTSDIQELWKKALVRIKFQADTDAPQWKTLQKFVKTADSMFKNPPRFYDK